MISFTPYLSPVMCFVADLSSFLGVKSLFTCQVGDDSGYLILAAMRMLVSVNRAYEAN